MAYGPEHSKVIRQVFGKEVDLPVADSTLWNYGSRNPNAHIDRIADHLRPGFRTYPQILVDGVRKVLRALHRHTLGRFLSDR
ncbi:hypothetical protein D9M68_853870 [compost metagenome]